MSDGPAGVRGVTMDDRNPSASLPCPSALGATWDRELVRELAAALGAEARGKGIDVLLAPTINLMRTPLGGRGFECVRRGPGADRPDRGRPTWPGCSRPGWAPRSSTTWATTPRPSAGPTTRGSPSTCCASCTWCRSRRACARRAWTLVMAAYNSVNGALMTEHAGLLARDPEGRMGLHRRGPVRLDAARSTVATAMAGLDLAMPGPRGPGAAGWPRRSAAAPSAEEVIDDKVLRLLRLARRVGALARTAPPRTGQSPDGIAPDGIGPDGSARTDRPGQAPGARRPGAAAPVPRPRPSCCCATRTRRSPPRSGRDRQRGA